MAQLVSDIAGNHFREAGHRVGNAFDDTERHRRNAKHGKKAGKDHRGGFVAEIAQCAGDARSGHSAVKPA